MVFNHVDVGRRLVTVAARSSSTRVTAATVSSIPGRRRAPVLNDACHRSIRRGGSSLSLTPTAAGELASGLRSASCGSVVRRVHAVLFFKAFFSQLISVKHYYSTTDSRLAICPRVCILVCSPVICICFAFAFICCCCRLANKDVHRGA